MAEREEAWHRREARFFRGQSSNLFVTRLARDISARANVLTVNPEGPTPRRKSSSTSALAARKLSSERRVHLFVVHLFYYLSYRHAKGGL